MSSGLDHGFSGGLGASMASAMDRTAISAFANSRFQEFINQRQARAPSSISDHNWGTMAMAYDPIQFYSGEPEKADGTPGIVPLSEVVSGARKLKQEEIEKRIMQFV